MCHRILYSILLYAVRNSYIIFREKYYRYYNFTRFSTSIMIRMRMILPRKRVTHATMYPTYGGVRSLTTPRRMHEHNADEFTLDTILEWLHVDTTSPLMARAFCFRFFPRSSFSFYYRNASQISVSIHIFSSSSNDKKCWQGYELQLDAVVRKLAKRVQK